MCKIDRIDAFLDAYPMAEFGPAHIVLSDCNIEDFHVDWCIRALQILTSDTPPPDSELQMVDAATWHAWRTEHDLAEHQAALAFLTEFRSIPEDERLEPGDQCCAFSD